MWLILDSCAARYQAIVVQFSPITKKSLTKSLNDFNNKGLKKVYFLMNDIFSFIFQFFIFEYNDTKLHCNQKKLRKYKVFLTMVSETIFHVKIKKLLLIQTKPKIKNKSSRQERNKMREQNAQRGKERRRGKDREGCLKETFWWMSRVLGQWQYN